MKIDEIKVILRKTYSFLSEEDLNRFLNICNYSLLKKRATFIKAGQNSDNVFFIIKGMMRGYFINETGEEKNIFLRQEHTISGPPEPAFYNLPTKYTFEAVLDSELLVFKFSELKKLAIQFPGIFKLHSAALQENLVTVVGRIEGLIDSTPEKRYDDLIKKNPQFFQSALNKHVANYLGITPNSLSRIISRKRKS